ncbi:MAG TPA: hypothetical protein VF601_19670 [Beijerinckiaceae bacterium]|jgi:hypothetical protein
MERRTFLLGLVGGLAAAAGLAATGSTPAEALPLAGPVPDATGKAGTEAADIRPEDLDGVKVEETQYWYRRRRRYYRRYYWRPRRRYYRRYWRRRRYW